MTTKVKMPEVIIISEINSYIVEKKGKSVLQIVGRSDNPRKMLEIQVWDMPFDTREECEKARNEYQQKLKDGNGTFIILKSC